MAEFIDIADLENRPVRPPLTEGVTGRQLLASPVAMSLTRVAPGGQFAPHRDAYDHLFLTLSGSGEVQVEGERRTLAPGQMVRIAAGEEHGYTNPEPEEWLLLSCNLPQQK